MSRSTLRVLAPLALLAPLAGSAEAGVGGMQRRRSFLVRTFVARANSPVRRRLLVRQRLEWPLATIRAAMSGTMVLVWSAPSARIIGACDPAPSSPRRRRCASPGAKPRLSRRAVPAPWRWRPVARSARRCGRSGLWRRSTVSSIWRSRRSYVARSPRRRRDRLPRVCRRRIPRRPWRRQFSSVSRRRSSPHRRACLARLCWRRRFAWAWRGHRSPHRRACLPRFCGRRGFHAGGGFHGLGGATGVHIGAPASPGFAGVGTFHAGGGFRIGGAERPTSARQPRQALLAEGFMASEGPELSRAAARGSDKAASDIAEARGDIRRQ